MEVRSKMDISLAFLVMLMALALALHASPCGATATSSLKMNGSTTQCNARTDEFLVADDNADLESMIGWGRSRMLDDDSIYLFELALNAKKPAVQYCGRPGEGYRPCPPKPNPTKPPEHCNPYSKNRACRF